MRLLEEADSMIFGAYDGPPLLHLWLDATDLNDSHQGEAPVAHGASRESDLKNVANFDTWPFQIQAADSYRGLIAADSTTGEDDPIVVVGRRPPVDTDVDGGGLGGDGDTGGAGTGDGGGGGGGTTETQANATPCVETSVSTALGATQQEINNAALAASNAIAAMNDEDYEYASIIYSVNGNVGWTQPYTQNLFDQVNWMGNISLVPTGAVIVGIVHNHPDDSQIDDRIPSGGRSDGVDWTSYDELVNWNSSHSGTEADLPRGITVDPNMLLYIYSNEDHETHVYDNTDKNQTSASCSL
jgi:hypothetical protein